MNSCLVIAVTRDTFGITYLRGMNETWLILSFFITAMLYASAGFGGGSTYLALLSTVHIDGGFMRAVAYACNMIVTGQSNVNYFKKRWIRWKEVWPFFLLSVPLAFLGGMVRLSQGMYLALLGLVLIVAAVWMLFSNKKRTAWGVFNTQVAQIGVGGAIGFLSGVVGIGGGIFLSPLLHSSKDFEADKIAAISSVFIFVNAFAGALGFFLNQKMSWIAFEAWPLFLAVLFGGLIGNFWTVSGKRKQWIRVVTAILVAIVGLRLFVGNIYQVLEALWN